MQGKRAVIATGRPLSPSRLGYALPAEVLAAYVCGHCDARAGLNASGALATLKLWRPIHDGGDRWCAACGTAQAGLPNTIDAEGRRAGEYGLTDQIYSGEKGLNLLPCVPTPNGFTWGYTSVPEAAVAWWRALPTHPAG